MNELVVGGGSEGEVNGNYWVLINTLYVILVTRVSVQPLATTPPSEAQPNR